MVSDSEGLKQVARGGLCADCRYARLIRSSKHSLFLMCKQPDLPKYQGQPVKQCAYYQVPLSEQV